MGQRLEQKVQRYWCNNCYRRFSDRTGTPMHRLQKSAEQVERTIKMRSNGMGLRASGRVESLSPTTVGIWEKRLAAQFQDWSPPAPAGSDITIEGMRCIPGEEKPPCL